MDYSWRDVSELSRKLRRMLAERNPQEVTNLKVTVEGDTVVLSGDVASEQCRGDAKRLALAFEGVMKVANRLVVAGFLEGATDSSDEDDFFDRATTRGGRSAAERAKSSEGMRRRSWQSEVGEWDRIRTKGRGTRDEGVVIGLTPIGPDAEPVGVEVSRYPTVAKEGEIAAGATVSIFVGLSGDAALGEGPISIGTFAADWTVIDVTVQIVGDWLKSVSPASGSVALRRDGAIDGAVFECVVNDDYVAGAPAELMVYYLHGTRVCGHLRRDLSTPLGEAVSADTGDSQADDVTEAAGASKTEDAKAPARAVTIVPEAVGPTLSVQIAPLDGGRQLWSWRAFGPGGLATGSDTVDLERSAKQFADALLDSCPELPATEFRRTMRGIGEAIWRKTPQGFRDCYAGCLARVGPGFAIQLTTDDHYVPWEMMKPDVDGVDHLHLDHPVARWPLNKAQPMRASFGAGEILSFVPAYATRPLASAASESGWICGSLGAVKMNSTRPVFLDMLDGKHPGPVRLIHFAGHGAADTGANDGAIEMEDAPVKLLDVYQSSVTIGTRDGPLVLLNACEVGAGSEMLGMNSGWGAAIAARGFGGLIAPLWAVQDTMAFTMAQAALPDLLSGSRTLGESVTAARKANADTSVAALAYLTHGDVMARFATS